MNNKHISERNSSILKTSEISALILTATFTICVLVSISTPVLAEPVSLQNINGSGTNENPYVITNVKEMQAISEDMDAHYVLGNDIDASETADWNAGAGFKPIGNEYFSQDAGSFSGILDGRNHTVKGLTIRRPNYSYMALFGVSEGVIKNIHISEAKIEGNRPGIIVGRNNADGIVKSASATGEVTGNAYITGGLVGHNEGKVIRSWTDVDIFGEEYQVGGLVGRNGGQVSDSYAKGDVTSNEEAGGAIGNHFGSVQRVYATGTVSADKNAGGVAERNAGLIVDSYWNIETTGQSHGVGVKDEAGTGLSTEEMTGPNASSSMEALVSDEAWTVTDGYPILQREVEGVSLSTDNKIVIAGNETDATVSLSLIGDRTETATTVADYTSNSPDIATISDGVVTAHQPGEVELSSTLAGKTGTTKVTVIANEGISTIDAEVGSTDVTAGETLSVSGTFRNVDENATYHHADLLVDDEVVTTENVTVDGSSDGTHSFEWTPENPGTYSLSIDGIDAGSVEVSPKSTTEQPAENNTGENTNGSSDSETGDDTQSGHSGSNDGDSGGIPLVPLAIGGVVVAGGGIVLGRRL